MLYYNNSLDYGFWDVLFAVLTFSVMVFSYILLLLQYLWRPVKNSKAYTHHMQVPMDEMKQDDEEYLGEVEDEHMYQKKNLDDVKA